MQQWVEFRRRASPLSTLKNSRTKSTAGIQTLKLRVGGSNIFQAFWVACCECKDLALNLGKCIDLCYF
ncbi:hypothetical protein MGG_16582 [Pyricularia oryzae 70-15]|uniref:Uncharacterized protein n=3 Tax=Pyricularia oryzae TaxID=318829 RepID=G5EHS4_PYRO7|nr:uncharacterized protein MGG_16582 [Pyricularia oryzae 70-15]EAQ70826.1 hypothetical protein MGCH7_ch7g233 [Pyricularia oryzae 70-15]EHA51358.1 hypothetical protein MGG_16582 [Pyricularia oryzae 70-15]ELQ40546.1 hypothetical protein OOU_Y34scaffold00420g1 [Pyricularia oryzae Y34]